VCELGLTDRGTEVWVNDFPALEIRFQHQGAVKEIGLFETKFQRWGIF
jgi:hypothetical protein